jgi:nucleoid-associated protein YgaU
MRIGKCLADAFRGTGCLMRSGLARLAIPVLAVVVFAAMLGWTALKRGASVATPPSTAIPTPPDRRPSATAPDARTEANAGALSATPPGPAANPPDAVATATPASPPDAKREAPSATIPSFDVVRVEPTGESVIAGRAAPGATVDLIANGNSLARAMADPSGLFAFVPPRLPPGSHEIVVQTIAPDGTRAHSTQSVTIAIAEKQDAPPLVAVSTPGQPTVLLSAPDPIRPPVSPPALAAIAPPPGAPATGVAPPAKPSAVARDAVQAGPPPSDGPAPVAAAVAPARRSDVRIASVEAEGTGRLFVSGSAAPGATLRLYLNDSFVAPGGTRPDGALSFTIERGIRPGDYRVRLDDVDPVSGTVRSLAEVPFNVPAPALVASAEPSVPVTSSIPSATSPQPARAAEDAAATAGLSPPAREAGVPSREARSAAGTTGAGQGAGATPRDEAPAFASRQSEPGTNVVPEVNTALVSRGDNLWRISKRAYGSGIRYTVIYGANLPQIRNPSLIYPGQVFVVPAGRDQVSR